MDVLDELISTLKRRHAEGVNAVTLSPETRSEFFGEASRRARGAAVRAGGSVQRAAAAPPRPAAPASTAHTAPAPAVAADSPAEAPAPASALAGLDLDGLRGRVASCCRCPLHSGRTQTVFGDGSPSASLMFIGEGPGRDEDAQGIPFVGAAGQLLNRMIAAMQFRREEVYIANIVKCRPPRNRAPGDDEAAMCLPYLERQIELVKPQVLVLLGAVPLRYLLGLRGINSLHGQWQEFRGIPVLPTFHPAYLLRVEAKKRDAWQDLQKVMRHLGKTPPATKPPAARGSG